MAAISRTGNRRRILGVLAWGLLFGGLFAMHGLGTHGTGAHAATGDPVQSASAQRADSPARTTHHVVAGTEQLSASHPARNASSDTSDPAGLMSGMVVMCLAILGGIITAIAAMILRLFRRGSLERPPRPVRRIGVMGRDRDPPCLVRLSVMRC